MVQFTGSSRAFSKSTHNINEARQNLIQAITHFKILWTNYRVAYDLPHLNQLVLTEDEETWLKYGQYIIADKSLLLAYSFPSTPIDEVAYWLRQVQAYDDYNNKPVQPIVVKDMDKEMPATIFFQQLSHFILLFFTACLCLTFAISSLIMFFNTVL